MLVFIVATALRSVTTSYDQLWLFVKSAGDTFRESPGNDERKTDLDVKSCSKDQECSLQS